MNTAVKVGIGVGVVGLVVGGGYFVYSRLPKPAPSGLPAGAKDGYFWLSKDGSPRQAATLDGLRAGVESEYGSASNTAMVKLPGGNWMAAAPLFASSTTSTLPPPPGPSGEGVSPLGKGPSGEGLTPLGPKGPSGEGLSALPSMAEQQAALADQAALAVLRMMGSTLQLTEMKTKDGHVLLMDSDGELHTADGKLYQTDPTRTVLLDGVQVYVKGGVPYLRNGIRAFTSAVNLYNLTALPQRMTMTPISRPIPKVGADLAPGGSMTWRQLRLRNA